MVSLHQPYQTSSLRWRCAIMYNFIVVANASITLMGDGYTNILGDISRSCRAAVNTILDCDPKVQLLSFDLDRLEWSQAKLTALCTPACRSSLQTLEEQVGKGCGGHEIPFNGATIAIADIVDLYLYKYNMSCLTEKSSGAFCHILEESWDVQALASSGKATWPAHTNITFPDFTERADGSPASNMDDTLLDESDGLFNFMDYGLELPWTGHDYYQSGISANWTGHGWPEALEYDEYPLEIQCSDCFLAQYKLGIESKWGEIFDEVSEQVWRNMQLNCHLDWELVPAHNFSTWTISSGPLTWTGSPKCHRNVYIDKTDSGGHGARGIWNAYDVAIEYNVPTQSVLHLNDDAMENVIPVGSYCLPEACQIIVIDKAQSAWDFASYHTNLTVTQFWQWNPYMEPFHMQVNEVFCIGPPGGQYTPIARYPNNSSRGSFSTPSSPTPTSTLLNKQFSSAQKPTPFRHRSLTNS